MSEKSEEKNVSEPLSTGSSRAVHLSLVQNVAQCKISVIKYRMKMR